MDQVRTSEASALPPAAAIEALDAEARELVESVLRTARERLHMNIAWLAEFRDDREIVRVIEGHRDDWPVREGQSIPAFAGYCKLMLEGHIPNAIPDTANEPHVAELPITVRLRVGSYIGVPLTQPDGTVFGTFCCARHDPNHALDDRDVSFMQVLARVVADEIAYRQMVRQAQRAERLAAGADALLAALAARDHYTSAHSRAVVDLACAVGRRLRLNADALGDLEVVALLHDVGKVGMPDEILLKPGPLSDREWETMRRHPVIGADILTGLPQLAHLAVAVRAEHERWDGLGYPDGLAGEQIPLYSRIVLVCDAYDAMISNRPYRSAMSRAAALDELRRCAGTMFWTPAVQAAIAEIVDSDIQLDASLRRSRDA